MNPTYTVTETRAATARRRTAQCRGRAATAPARRARARRGRTGSRRRAGARCGGRNRPRRGPSSRRPLAVDRDHAVQRRDQDGAEQQHPGPVAVHRQMRDRPEGEGPQHRVAGDPGDADDRQLGALPPRPHLGRVGRPQAVGQHHEAEEHQHRRNPQRRRSPQRLIGRAAIGQGQPDQAAGAEHREQAAIAHLAQPGVQHRPQRAGDAEMQHHPEQRGESEREHRCGLYSRTDPVDVDASNIWMDVDRVNIGAGRAALPPWRPAPGAGGGGARAAGGIGAGGAEPARRRPPRRRLAQRALPALSDQAGAAGRGGGGGIRRPVRPDGGGAGQRGREPPRGWRPGSAAISASPASSRGCSG